MVVLVTKFIESLDPFVRLPWHREPGTAAVPRGPDAPQRVPTRFMGSPQSQILTAPWDPEPAWKGRRVVDPKLGTAARDPSRRFMERRCIRMLSGPGIGLS